MDAISTGAEAQAKGEKAHTADPSASSAKSGKPRTTKTVPLDPGRALEILEAAIVKCQEAGIEIGTSSFYHGGVPGVAIVVGNCMIVTEGDKTHLALRSTTSGKGGRE